MDQIKVKSVKVVAVADGLLQAELPASTLGQSELTSLEEWEMVLASGGEGIPCW